MALEDQALLLIVRHLNTPEDEHLSTAVENWRAQAPGNETYYREVCKLWQASSAASVLRDIDVATAVARLEEKMPPLPEAAPGLYVAYEAGVVRSRRKRWVWSAAAAVAALLAVTGGYRLTRKETVKMLTRTTHQLRDSLQLSDGSTVYLDVNTTLAYPEKFVADNRNIVLENGDAFFKIAQDSMRPFTVTMDRTAVKVLGTSFNIHKDTTHISVDVKTGRVMFLSDNQPMAVLNAGTIARYNLQTDSIITYSNQNQNSDAWLTGELRFVDEPLKKVFGKLEDHYHVQIDLDTNLSNLGKLNATFNNNSLEEVIKLLEQTYPIRIEQQGDRLIVKNK